MRPPAHLLPAVLLAAIAPLPLLAQQQGAVQESRDTVVATSAAARSPFAVAGASTIVILPDSLPDVPRTMTELLMMGAPGVFVQHSSGAAGAGAWISIRDGAAVRGAEPLIVVDGVPEVGFVPRFREGAEIRPPSRLDEIPVDAVERVEILAGPAAAARWGRDARNGVIELTTRRVGQGRASLHASLSGIGIADGDVFPRNDTQISNGSVCTYANAAAGSCGTVTPSRYTPLLDASPFRTAAGRQGHVDVAGGYHALGYAADLSHSVTGGVLAADGADLTTGGARLTLPLPFAGARLAIVSRATGRGATIPYEGSVSLVNSGLGGAIDCSPATPCQGGDTVSRGYGFATAPGDFARRATMHRIQHFTNGGSFSVQPLEWLALRSAMSVDVYGDRGGYGYTYGTDHPEAVRFRHFERSVRDVLAQDVVARRALGSWELTVPLGFRADHERGRTTAFDSIGTPPPVLYNIQWNGFAISERRQTTTLAPRLSGSGASFGASLVSTRTRIEQDYRTMKATLDGGTDASFVATDRAEGALRRLVLRAAAGQVSAYDLATDLSGFNADVPSFLAMPGSWTSDVHPDRTFEGEGGIDVAFGPAVTRLSFTAYHRRETHRGVVVSLAPGGPGSPSPFGSVRRAVNGLELAAIAVPLDRGAARLETSLAFTLQRDRLLSGVDPNYSYYYSGSPYGYDGLLLEKGHSFASWRALSYTYADTNGDGRIEGYEMRATGNGYVGRSRPSRFGALDTRLTVARRWTLGANLGYQGGFKVLDAVETRRCWTQICDAAQSSALGDQAFVLAPGSAPYFVSGEALRIRELSLGWETSAAARLARAGRSRVVFAVRNVATFSHAKYLDPEVDLPAPGLGPSSVQGPGLALPRTVSLRLAFAY